MTRLLLFLAAIAAAYVAWTACTGGEAHAAGGVPICVVNHSSNVSDAGLAAELPAFQTAVDRDFGPVWNAYATLKVCQGVGSGSSIELVDETQLAGAAGYHWTRTRPDCLPSSQPGASETPCAVVGTRTGINWQLTFSHELFEMLADPRIDRYSSPSIYARHWNPVLVEVCDPVELFGFGYWIDGVRISDFVTPAWYTGTGGVRLDFTGHVRHFRHVLQGGHVAAVPLPDPYP